MSLLNCPHTLIDDWARNMPWNKPCPEGIHYVFVKFCGFEIVITSIQMTIFVDTYISLYSFMHLLLFACADLAVCSKFYTVVQIHTSIF
jgi:hypothetical protein